MYMGEPVAASWGIGISQTSAKCCTEGCIGIDVGEAMQVQFSYVRQPMIDTINCWYIAIEM
jgi:hypothetical protein